MTETSPFHHEPALVKPVATPVGPVGRPYRCRGQGTSLNTGPADHPDSRPRAARSEVRARVLLQPLVGLAPWPAEQAEAGDDARPSDNGPERAAGHRRSLDQVKPLPEPYRAGHDKQPSDHASGDGHGIHYEKRVPSVSRAAQVRLVARRFR
jgi:hypothetical protein